MPGGADTPRGSLELTWGESPMEGIACSLDSEGFHALKDATFDVLGKAVPYSICGSLPLVRDLQRGGFDIQLTGFGRSDVYHADNEYCQLTDMQNGFQICCGIIAKLGGEASA